MGAGSLFFRHGRLKPFPVKLHKFLVPVEYQRMMLRLDRNVHHPFGIGIAPLLGGFRDLGVGQVCRDVCRDLCRQARWGDLLYMAFTVRGGRLSRFRGSGRQHRKEECQYDQRLSHSSDFAWTDHER